MGIPLLNKNREHTLESYYVGERDERQWGFYEVTGKRKLFHSEYCEKKITIYPRRALSLQRHYQRHETWRILQGEIIAIIDGDIKNLSVGDHIKIPRAAPHALINLSTYPVLIYEKQFGICREKDNERLCDINGRKTVKYHSTDPMVRQSVKIYKELTRHLGKCGA